MVISRAPVTEAQVADRAAATVRYDSMKVANQLQRYACTLSCMVSLVVSQSSAANIFRGVWVTRASLCDSGGNTGCEHKREAGASLWLYQFGNRICGQWSQGIYGGRVWTGNVIGVVYGNLARVRIGQDLEHSGSRPYPLQAASPTLFRLRAGKLVWYTDRGATQERYALRRAGDPLLKAHFNDQEFLRLCRQGIDFQ